MNKLRFSVRMLIVLCMISTQTFSQCIQPADMCGTCVAISRLPDTVGPLCPGTIYSVTPIVNWTGFTLTGYSWSPAVATSTTAPAGSTMTSIPTTIIVPVTTTTYSLTVTALGPNLVTNGNFALGNSCFITGYTYDPVLAHTWPLLFHYLRERFYNIANNTVFASYGPWAVPVNPPGGGNMMIVNGALAANKVVWQETINNCPGATYQFTAYCANWSIPTSPARLQVLINGTPMTTFTSVAAAGTWQEIQFNYSGASPATIQIIDLNTAGNSNDFVLDNISFQRICKQTKAITIIPRPIPLVSPIIGPPTVCLGDTIQLSNATHGGTWSSSSPNVVVSPTGFVIGTAIGTAIIKYTIPNICGPITVTYTVTVTGPPTVAPIIGADTICTMSTKVLTDVTPGGTWTSTNTLIATIDPTTGVVSSGTTTGTTIIKYSVSNSCGTTTVIFPVTVIGPPTVAPITGPRSLCMGDRPIIYTDPGGSPGGTWSCSSTPAIATIGPSTGVLGFAPITLTSPVILTITYTNTNPCGTVSTTYLVTVNPLPTAWITYSGPDPVCEGGLITFTIHATAGSNVTYDGFPCNSGTHIPFPCSSVGITMPGSSGTTTHDVTVVATAPVTTIHVLSVVDPRTGCRNNVNLYKQVRVDRHLVAGTIVGPRSVCMGEKPVIYTDPMGSPGGTWSCSSTPAIATIDPSTGILGFAAMTLTSPVVLSITYTNTNSCGTVSTTCAVVVNPNPTAWVTYGGCDPACPGSPLTFTIHATGGSRVTYDVAGATHIITMPAGSGVTTDNVTVSAIAPATIFLLDGVVNPRTGCSQVIDQFIKVKVSYPSAYFSSTPRVGCPGDPVILQVTGTQGSVVHITPTPGFSFTVTLPASTSSATTSAYTTAIPLYGTTTFCITSVTNSCCSSVTTGPCITLTPHAVPTLAISNSMPVCSLSAFTLYATGTPCTNYTWTGPSISGSLSTGSTSHVSTSGINGTYCVTGTNSYGCSTRVCETVTADPPPHATITGTNICEGQSTTATLTFTGTVGSTVYYQSTPPTGTSSVYLPTFSGVTVSVTPPSTPTIYTIMHVTDASGCSSMTSGPSYTVETLMEPWAYVTHDLTTTPFSYIILAGGSDCEITVTYQLDLWDGVTNRDSVATDTVHGGLNIQRVIGSSSVNLVTILSVSACGCTWDVDTSSGYKHVNTGNGKPTFNASSSYEVRGETFTGDVANGNASIKTNGITVAGDRIQSLSVIPNPNKGTFTVTGYLPSMTSSEEVRLEVVDMLGKTVYSTVSPIEKGNVNSSITLNNEVANGIYLVMVKNEQVSAVIRFTLSR